jgi:hypothetical protein
LLDIGVLTRLAPSNRRKVEEPVLWPARQQAEDIAQVGPWLDVAESAAREQRSEGGIDGTRVVAADEELNQTAVLSHTVPLKIPHISIAFCRGM